jgi:hypothetical protein
MNQLDLLGFTSANSGVGEAGRPMPELKKVRTNHSLLFAIPLSSSIEDSTEKWSVFHLLFQNKPKLGLKEPRAGFGPATITLPR